MNNRRKCQEMWHSKHQLKYTRTIIA